MPFPENTPPPPPEADFYEFLPEGESPKLTPAARLAAARAAFRRFERPPMPPGRRYALHIGLFIITLGTTTLAGIQLTRGEVGLLAFDVLALRGAALWAELRRGLWFALPFLGVLTVHEFGHYFMARHHRVRTSLPYYIPFPLGFGTFGAIIRIKDRIFSRRDFFDIGLAGPLAGFLVAVPLLIYGFATLPPLAYLFAIHPDYAPYGADYAQYVYQGQAGGTVLAQPLLFRGLAAIFADPARLPHPNELLHYPVLLAGALSLFFTALNLLPIGQLDGGHILYGLLGPRQASRLAVTLFIGFIFYAGLGLFTLPDSWDSWLYGGPVYALYLWGVFRRMMPSARQTVLLAGAVWLAQLALTVALPAAVGNPGWLLFGLLLGRVAGVRHPPAPDERPLSPGRQVLGWLMVIIFVLCATPSPFEF